MIWIILNPLLIRCPLFWCWLCVAGVDMLQCGSPSTGLAERCRRSRILWPSSDQQRSMSRIQKRSLPPDHRSAPGAPSHGGRFAFVCQIWAKAQNPIDSTDDNTLHTDNQHQTKRSYRRIQYPKWFPQCSTIKSSSRLLQHPIIIIRRCSNKASRSFPDQRWFEFKYFTRQWIQCHSSGIDANHIIVVKDQETKDCQFHEKVVRQRKWRPTHRHCRGMRIRQRCGQIQLCRRRRPTFIDVVVANPPKRRRRRTSTDRNCFPKQHALPSSSTRCKRRIKQQQRAVWQFHIRIA